MKLPLPLRLWLWLEVVVPTGFRFGGFVFCFHVSGVWSFSFFLSAKSSLLLPVVLRREFFQLFSFSHALSGFFRRIALADQSTHSQRFPFGFHDASRVSGREEQHKAKKCVFKLWVQ
jgi:hypothetical protein